MPATVNIESAGDHCFDMAHLRRSGAEDLIYILLEKAGYYENLVWRVRVNEKQRCSGMTPPISVIRHREWGVYLRIKPGDNNTCHNVTLIVPAGCRTSEVYNKLKTIEKSFNRNWRKVESTVPATVHVNEVNGTVEETPCVVHTEGELIESEMEIAEIETENQRFDVQVFLKNQDNIKALCLSVYLMEEEQRAWKDTTQFMTSLYQRLNIVLSGRQGGAMMRSLINRGLIRKIHDGTRHVGYVLTRKGRDLVKDSISKPLEKVEVVEQPKPIERLKLISELGPIAQDISHAFMRLKEIEAERIDYEKKIEALDREKQELSELFDGTEIEKFLSHLVDIKLK